MAYCKQVKETYTLYTNTESRCKPDECGWDSFRVDMSNEKRKKKSIPIQNGMNPSLNHEILEQRFYFFSLILSLFFER